MAAVEQCMPVSKRLNLTLPEADLPTTQQEFMVYDVSSFGHVHDKQSFKLCMHGHTTAFSFRPHHSSSKRWRLALIAFFELWFGREDDI
jgi:hypothetical protein